MQCYETDSKNYRNQEPNNNGMVTGPAVPSMAPIGQAWTLS